MQGARLYGGAIALSMLLCSAASASELPARIEHCAAITSDTERLRCFDELAASAGMGNKIAMEEPLAAPPEAEDAAAVSAVTPVEPVAAAGRRKISALDRHWELDEATKRGIFSFRPHQDNYFLISYNHAPNNAPYDPFRVLTPESEGLSKNELAFQLGFKLKLVESLFETPADLWFGYTQRSFWQAGNRKASSPFRETNYQPEIMLVIPVKTDVAGMKMRFLNLGFVHQSNGQVSLMSRSWNRLYAQAGFERGNFSLLARVWNRIDESADVDDNPDIEDYLGRGDVVATYRRNGHEVSLLARRNFRTDKGAAQLSWAFPLVSNLKGYVQVFSGYGYTLIDYNAFQRVLGMGILVEF